MKKPIEPVEETKEIQPLDLHLEGTLGNENLHLVVEKLNEVISHLKE